MNTLVRNIVITGASSGIGAKLAGLYASANVKLALIARSQERLERIANECRSKGANVEIVSIDITNEQVLSQWILNYDDEHPVDLIIASAGISNSINRNAPLEAMESIKTIFDTNFYGVISTINPVLERMCSRKSGQVVIISSLSAYRGIPFLPAYSASKAAIKSYFESLRGLLKENGVTVSIACPSFIITPMTSDFQQSKTMMISVDKAARKIKQGVDNKQALISFPLSHVFGLWLLGLLPNKLADGIILLALGMRK